MIERRIMPWPDTKIIYKLKISAAVIVVALPRRRIVHLIIKDGDVARHARCPGRERYGVGIRPDRAVWIGVINYISLPSALRRSACAVIAAYAQILSERNLIERYNRICSLCNKDCAIKNRQDIIDDGEIGRSGAAGSVAAGADKKRSSATATMQFMLKTGCRKSNNADVICSGIQGKERKGAGLSERRARHAVRRIIGPGLTLILKTQRQGRRHIVGAGAQIAGLVGAALHRRLASRECQEGLIKSAWIAAVVAGRRHEKSRSQGRGRRLRSIDQQGQPMVRPIAEEGGRDGPKANAKESRQESAQEQAPRKARRAKNPAGKGWEIDC